MVMDFSRFTRFENDTNTCTCVMMDEMMVHGPDGKEGAYGDVAFVDCPIR